MAGDVAKMCMMRRSRTSVSRIRWLHHGGMFAGELPAYTRIYNIIYIYIYIYIGVNIYIYIYIYIYILCNMLWN